MSLKKLSSVLCVIVMGLVSGCVSVKHTPLTKTSSESLQGKSLTTTQYPMPDFTAMTAGKASFALVGAAAMISAGNKIVKENNIADPATAISEGLVEKLTAARNIKLVNNTASVVKKNDVKSLVAANKGVDYVLDIKTMNWMFGYYPTDWTHYRVMYNARLRLIDTKTSKVIAETLCRTIQGDDKNPPTHDQLLENNAGLLKEYLSKGASQCIDLLAKDILML